MLSVAAQAGECRTCTNTCKYFSTTCSGLHTAARHSGMLGPRACSQLLQCCVRPFPSVSVACARLSACSSTKPVPQSAQWTASSLCTRHATSQRMQHSRAGASPGETAASPAKELGLPSQELGSLVQDAVVWANQHGLVVALNDPAFVNPALAVIHAPLAALPVAFPRERFLQAKAAMPLFNLLVDAVARDEAYLETTLAAAAQFDDFTARLLQLLVSSRPARQRLAKDAIVLGIHRSDYMLDAPSGGFLQVELNTIASSFGCLSSLVTSLHRYLSGRIPGLDAGSLPDNPSINMLPAAIAAAAKARGLDNGVVVMVVQPGERNAYDQQWIQLKLWEEHGLRTIRMSLAQVAQTASLRDSDSALMVPSTSVATSPASTHSIHSHASGQGKGGSGGSTHSGSSTSGSSPPVDSTAPPPHGQAQLVPVSVVYFRAGYSPNDYPSQCEWQGRAVIEDSSAVKCPSVAYQLAGAKKVQQDLASPGMLARFLPADKDVQTMLQLFAGLWGLDDLSHPETQKVVADAIANPDAYVLKPQREGGGNNLYGDQLVEMLQAGKGLSAYILMQKIRPPPAKGILVRHGKFQEAEVVSELGIYGTFVKRGNEVLLNAEAGHLVRTKDSSSNEGGVAAGFAVLDSPRLV